MTRPTIRASIIVATLALLAMASGPALPEDWERLGNQAFQAGRFDEAVRCYENAAQRSHQPGRVAHNQAVAFFNMGRYREAERLFRCELESNPDGDARASALYDLGSCLLLASEGRDADRLAEAIDDLGRCLRMKPADKGLRIDAKYNLELAKRQWRKIRSDSPPPAEKKQDGNDENPQSSNNDQNSGTEPGNQMGNSGGAGRMMGTPLPAGNAGQQPIATAERTSGDGSMSPISDDEQLKPLPPAEARELLRQAAERIARERRALKRANLGTTPKTYPDW